jgi:IS5 family transposase
VWLFKERLGKEGVKKLFKQFKSARFEIGLTASSGKIVDETIVETKRVHTKKKPADELEPGPRWTKKRQQSYFGYKNHIKVNAESKLIETYEATPADIHDESKIEALAAEQRDQSIHADSVYCDKEERLREKGIEITGAAPETNVNRCAHFGYCR